MRLDGSRVAQLRQQAGLTLIDVQRSTGRYAMRHPGPMNPRQIVMVDELREVEEGDRELTEQKATMLAAVLEVGLSELLPPGDERRLVWVGEQLARCQVLLEECAAALAGQGRCPACSSADRWERLRLPGSAGTCPSEFHACAHPWHDDKRAALDGA